MLLRAEATNPELELRYMRRLLHQPLPPERQPQVLFFQILLSKASCHQSRRVEAEAEIDTVADTPAPAAQRVNIASPFITL